MDQFGKLPGESLSYLEREAVKPYTVSRKYVLFSGSPAGAESTALFFSLIATAKEHGLNPHVYLYYIIKKAPYATTLEDWNALLPWNVTIPKKLDRSYIEGDDGHPTANLNSGCICFCGV